MPVVPFRPDTQAQVPSIPPPKSEFMLMAAAQMHKEGRLVAQQDSPTFTYTGKHPSSVDEWRSAGDQVDKFIQQQGLKKDQQFNIKGFGIDDGPYQYLGPNSGGERDWMIAPKAPKSDLVS